MLSVLLHYSLTSGPYRAAGSTMEVDCWRLTVPLSPSTLWLKSFAGRRALCQSAFEQTALLFPLVIGPPPTERHDLGPRKKIVIRGIGPPRSIVALADLVHQGSMCEGFGPRKP